jgi:hypothetical protein
VSLKKLATTRENGCFKWAYMCVCTIRANDYTYKYTKLCIFIS